jgi:hypothetical protein
MKLKQIAMIVVGLSSSAISYAAPVTVAEIDAANTASTLQQAWITGATAPTQTVYEGWVRGCDVDTNTIFSTQSGTTNLRPGSIGNFSAYACKRGGKVSVLYHTLDGGSLNAYTPHTVNTVLARIKYVGTGNGCAASATYTDNANSNNSALVYKGCALVGRALSGPGGTASSADNTFNQTALSADTLGPQRPVGGYSDVEAALFPASIGGGNVSSKGTETEVGVGQVFGVAVSKPLYRALQTAQGLSDVDANTFDPVNAPNINSSQYASLIAANGTTTWDVLLPGNTAKVILARRAETSGTQASSNAFFLKNPCASGVNQATQPSDASNSVSGSYEVTLHSGSGNVKTALTNASNAVNAADQFAIGVLSVENNWRTDSSSSNGYRYLKLDGVHPEADDVASGRKAAARGEYKFHMEMRQFIRADGQHPKTAFEASVLNEITAQLKNPPANSCTTFPRGLTLNPGNGSACTYGVEIAKMTNFGSNCATPIEFPAQ